MPSRPISPNPQPTKFLRSKLLLLAITLSATVIFLLTILYILYNLWSTFFHRSRTNPFDSIPPLKTLKKFSYKDLKFATNGFHPDHSIGKGGSATVFRGVLRDGKTVAIKRLEDYGGEREFQCELSILAGIKSPHVVSLLGYCVERNKRVLVYEYMPNRSLQELLFSEGNLSSANWDRRFQIIQDVARALEFLHNECDPPVIHGDIKPSNVLLDWDFRAKISDFGLSRVKGEDEFGVEMFSQEMGRSQDLWKSQDLSGNLNLETSPKITTFDEGNHSCGEVDFALALQASSSTKNGRVFQGLSPKGKEVVVEDGVDVSGEDWRKFNGCFDQEVGHSVEHSKELELNASPAKQWGKDWWWKQDDSGELSSKDYVSEWIGCQINPEWENVSSSPMEPNLLENSPRLDSNNLKEEENESPRIEFHVGCVEGKSFEQKRGIGKHGHKTSNKPRKMQDWWKEEEELDELNKRRSNSKRKTTLENKMRKSIKMPHFDLGRRFYILKRRRSSMDHNQNSNLNHEFGFKKGSWRRKHAHTHTHTRSMGSEMSGDLFSRELSSTTSMRGTLCYVAPEYGGCGYLVEKGDIYSLGVLILVIISGRRPLHVLNSPMKLEKANLISWCRHLAQYGNVLELVDEKLKDLYNKEEALLCIHLALACLQRVPELRPEIGDIVKILRGEMELPPLPFEFSPSPPPKLHSRSRRKQKSNPE